MRHQGSSSLPLPGPARGGDWRVIGTLLPYLWAYKSRVILALVALVAAKVANIGVPLLLKQIVDSLDARTATLAEPFTSASVKKLPFETFHERMNGQSTSVPWIWVDQLFSPATSVPADLTPGVT